MNADAVTARWLSLIDQWEREHALATVASHARQFVRVNARLLVEAETLRARVAELEAAVLTLAQDKERGR